MTATSLNDADLDHILTLQVLVAWAGEGECEPRRLGWWRTDLVDDLGGGDLLARLLPRSHAWAALEAVREAARRIDEGLRKGMADADALRTLYFLGFELDEKLDERLALHKRRGTTPADALPLPFALGETFDRGALEGPLQQGVGEVGFTVVPGGRQVKARGAEKVPDEPLEMVQRLAAALVPFAEIYPMPFYRVG